MEFPEWIEVFSTGEWTDSQGNTRQWTLDDLNEIASSYDAKNQPAPIVIGHPETDSPAYGWIESLKIEGEKLLAKPFQLAEEFIDWVKRGLYKKISVAIYPDLTLKHIGFLGGAAPAVKGLKPVAFGDKKGAWTFDLPRLRLIEAGMDSTLTIKEGDYTPDSQGDTHKKGGNIMYEWLTKMKEAIGLAEKSLTPDPSVKFTEADVQAKVNETETRIKRETEATFAEAQKKIEAEKKEKETAQKKLKEIETQARKDKIHSFCEGLAKEGKIIPAWQKMGIEEFLFSLDDSKPFQFASPPAEALAQARWFKDFLGEIPKSVTFNKVTPNEGPGTGGSAGDKLSALTKQKMESKKDLSYGAAFAEVQKENQELAKEYLAEINPNKK